MTVTLTSSRPLLVADTGRLHLTSGQRTLCGHLHVDPRDVYDQEAGWRVWEGRSGDRCTHCVRSLECAGRSGEERA